MNADDEIQKMMNNYVRRKHNALKSRHQENSNIDYQEIMFEELKIKENSTNNKNYNHNSDASDNGDNWNNSNNGNNGKNYDKNYGYDGNHRYDNFGDSYDSYNEYDECDEYDSYDNFDSYDSCNNNNYGNSEMLCENIDFMQYQINCLTKELEQCKEMHKCETNRYLQLIREIDNINDNTEQISNTQLLSSFSSNNKILSFDDPTIIYEIKPGEIQSATIFITMVGGGGSGGIGFVSSFYYYSGGGGGAGASFIKKPICVSGYTKIVIKIGKGGVSSDSNNNSGEDTYIKVFTKCDTYTLTAKGGTCGYPTINQEQKTCGGEGGTNPLNPLFNGQNGFPGDVTIPSQIMNCSGNGGNSYLYKGGCGGNNYFSEGGIGGCVENFIGKDGCFGSGGGGSCPVSCYNKMSKKSGNGGNGFLLIEQI